MQFKSTKNRPVHLGKFPLEKLARVDQFKDWALVPGASQLSFQKTDDATSIIYAMGEYQAMLDAIRTGFTNEVIADCPTDLIERAQHLKAFGYFCDASMVGIGALPKSAILAQPFRNSDIDRLVEKLQTAQTATFASGIDAVMADLKDSVSRISSDLSSHTHIISFLYEFPREPRGDETGCQWVHGAQEHRACLRGAETAIVAANYLRLLGYDAIAHTPSTSGLDLNQVAIASGLAVLEDGQVLNPILGQEFGIATVSTNFEMRADKPLAPLSKQTFRFRSATSRQKNQPFAKRRFVDGAFPFEKLKRVDNPTTYIDAPNVARVPKRTDMFARALFGDMGPKVQKAAHNGHYVRKTGPSMAQRRVLGSFTIIQNGEKADQIDHESVDSQQNAENIKAAAYYLGVDAVGISACPEWVWYSHNALGEEIIPKHENAISVIIDQGFETMLGSSGDDWIAVAQSMRAYLRFSLLGGVLAQHIRNLGYDAKAHTVMDGDVLQPPLLLLSGLGEVSRIGEVILNPYLGPRLKSGVVTTTMPMDHDKPIDFGLQKFCESCNKCARECPSGAITAGPKLMFNGYEIWKSDSQKCATYRMTTKGGAMCGRCMKTCPWNLEGLFAEAPFRWAAMNIPKAAPLLAKLDDVVGNGEIEPIKKWWWDLELKDDGGYRPTHDPTNKRPLNKEFKLKYEDQTLAVYPATLAPPPWPYPFPMDREKGIEAYQAMITAEQYKLNSANGDNADFIHTYQHVGNSPVLQVLISDVIELSNSTTLYTFESVDGSNLPKWTAGAHIDIVVAPEYLRQYSLCSNPSDPSNYQIAVLKEPNGRGGSELLQRIFKKGRRIFISKPINHFKLNGNGKKSILMGGGIGVTPLIAMAHQLHDLGNKFELHYSIPSHQHAGFVDILCKMPWYKSVLIHCTEDGTRADLSSALNSHEDGTHIYTCGPDAYMNAVLAAGLQCGFPEDNLHREYFSAPEVPDYISHDFVLKLARSGKELQIPKDKAATEVLLENGYSVEVKCSDGLCGTCKCGLIAGEVQHRDFVLSKKQRESSIILCQSRAAVDGGVVEIDL